MPDPDPELLSKDTSDLPPFTPAAQTTHIDPEKPVDYATIFKVLKHTKGSIPAAVNLLKQAGYTDLTKHVIEDSIEKNAILKAHFGEGSPIIHDQSIGLDVINRPSHVLAGGDVDKQATLAQQASDLAVQDKLLELKGLEGAGLSVTEIQKLQSYAQFANHGFRTSLDFAHGITATQIVRLADRAEHIASEILLNEDNVDHTSITKEGAIITYTGKKYSPAEKLEWQEQYTKLMDLIRKTSDTIHKAAKVRLALYKQERKDNGDNKPKAKRRLKGT